MTVNDAEMVELELGHIIGVHVGDKLKSIHCVAGTGLVLLETGTPFAVDDIGQVVTGHGWPADTRVAMVVSGRVACMTKLHTAEFVGMPP